VTSSLAVFEAAIWVKSTHLIKSCLKTKKGENMEIKVAYFFGHPVCTGWRQKSYNQMVKNRIKSY